MSIDLRQQAILGIPARSTVAKARRAKKSTRKAFSNDGLEYLRTLVEADRLSSLASQVERSLSV